jgi:hypothetical protein
MCNCNTVCQRTYLLAAYVDDHTLLRIDITLRQVNNENHPKGKQQQKKLQRINNRAGERERERDIEASLARGTLISVPLFAWTSCARSEYCSL